MLVLGSQLHVLTFIIVILELMTLPFVGWYYYAWPQDKGRLWYFVLLSLLVVYNLTGGLFPDPKIREIPVMLQNIIAYGSGFVMASYFPWYFYKAFGLDSLRFHALKGVFYFLLCPYVLFFWVLYPLTGDLGWVISYGMIVPMLYSPVLLWAMLISIQRKFSGNELALYPYRKHEMWAVYWAVSPWVLMSVFSYLQVSQWIEVLVTNTGFVIITGLFMLRSGRMERMEKRRMLEMEAMDEQQQLDFAGNCERYGLTRREIQVAERHCQGLTYEQIADNLFIGKRTVDTHVQKIYFKTGVNRKIDLREKLGYAPGLSKTELND